MNNHSSRCAQIGEFFEKSCRLVKRAADGKACCLAVALMDDFVKAEAAAVELGAEPFEMLRAHHRSKQPLRTYHARPPFLLVRVYPPCAALALQALHRWALGSGL